MIAGRERFTLPQKMNTLTCSLRTDWQAHEDNTVQSITVFTEERNGKEQVLESHKRILHHI